MTSRTSDTRTALDAYLGHHTAALALLARITEHLANHDDAPVEDPDTALPGATWATSPRPAGSSRRFATASSPRASARRRLPPLPPTFGSSAELSHHYRTAH
jgi:hypothetical protein